MSAFSDPDLPCEDVREPFRTLPIRFINIPMDFRMDFVSLQKLLNDVKPKYVLSSSTYTQPMARRPDLRIHYEKIWPIEYDESVQLSKLSRNKRKLVTVEVHHDIVKNMKFKQHPTKKLAVASVACHLSAYNDEFKLVPTKDRIAKQKFGRLTIDKLLKTLRDKNLEVTLDAPPVVDNDDLEEGQVVEEKTETVMHIEELEAKITLKNDGSRTKVTAQNAETREKIMDIIKTMLVEDDGIVGRAD
uniref:Uncharacterized protein n=1 Tax=Caenorhabditis japonica TaxID=281687 RepID=A0A8R1E0H7_CAEJA